MLIQGVVQSDMQSGRVFSMSGLLFVLVPLTDVMTKLQGLC